MYEISRGVGLEPARTLQWFLHDRRPYTPTSVDVRAIVLRCGPPVGLGSGAGTTRDPDPSRRPVGLSGSDEECPRSRLRLQGTQSQRSGNFTRVSGEGCGRPSVGKPVSKTSLLPSVRDVGLRTRWTSWCQCVVPHWSPFYELGRPGDKGEGI